MGASASMYSRREPRHPDEQCALRSARTLRRNQPYNNESWTCGLTNAQIERIAVKYRNIGESEAAVLSELRAGIRAQRFKIQERVLHRRPTSSSTYACNRAHDIAACTGDLGPRCPTSQGHVIRCPWSSLAEARKHARREQLPGTS